MVGEIMLVWKVMTGDCVHNSHTPMNILLVILYMTDNCILGTKGQKGN